MTTPYTRKEKRWRELCALEEAGLIKDLQRDAPFILTIKNDEFTESRVVTDFYYIDSDERQITETVISFRRGSKFQLFKLKQKMMYHVHKIYLKAV